MSDKEFSEMKKGIVLEGGGMRGLFSCGIIDVLLENHITFDGAVGVSAGAAFGCNLKSKQLGRALRYNLRFAGDNRYCSLFSLFKTGDLYNADFCYRRIPNELDLFDYETLKKNPMEFFMVVTDIESGKPVYSPLTDGNPEELEWMRASASMPLVARPVLIDGKKYLDGGISDSIPLKFMESKGYKKNIVILTQPKNYVKTKNGALPIVKLFLKKYPNLIQALASRHKMYNAETHYVFEQEKLGNALVFCPETSLNISRTEKNKIKLQEVYDQGRILALKRLDEIKKFLEK